MLSRVKQTLHGVLCALSCIFATLGLSDTYRVDHNASIFAVITHKGGIAAAMAHNHLVYPESYDATIQIPGDTVTSGYFEIQFPAEKLVADDPTAQEIWFSKIQQRGLLAEEFPTISAEDRNKIRQSMLGTSQLDAGQFPTITAETQGIKTLESTEGEAAGANYAIDVALTVHGETETATFPAVVHLEGNRLEVEAWGTYRFTDFGIKPFSAFFGAVRNKNPFDVFVHVVAYKDTSPENEEASN